MNEEYRNGAVAALCHFGLDKIAQALPQLPQPAAPPQQDLIARRPSLLPRTMKWPPHPRPARTRIA